MDLYIKITKKFGSKAIKTQYFYRKTGLKFIDSYQFQIDKALAKWMYTLPTIEILSAKNARAWVSMVSYLKK